MSFVKIIRICETLLMCKHFTAVLGFGNAKMSRCGQEYDAKLCTDLTLNIFGAFAMLRKTTVSCAIPVCLSVCRHGTAGFTLDGFLWFFHMWDFF